MTKMNLKVNNRCIIVKRLWKGVGIGQGRKRRSNKKVIILPVLEKKEDFLGILVFANFQTSVGIMYKGFNHS